MAREFPEVEDFLRMNGWGPTVIEYNKQTFTEEHFIEVDSSFFDFFSIPVLKGDKQNLLNSPRKVVLSESTAKKIFGEEDPIDKYIKMGQDTARYLVSGVFGDLPANTHFEANILGSFMTNSRSANPIWLSNSFSTYLLLKPNTSWENVDAKIPSMLEKYVGPEVQRFMGISLEDFLAQGNRYRYFLQPLTKVHLDPSIQQQFKDASDPKYLWIFGCIALLIVLIATINFMNLSTAQSARRAKEVGIKKLGGSTKGMLVTQFLTESFILSFVSLIFAVIIVKISLPYFSNLLGISLELKLLKSMFTIPALLLFAVFVGLLAGSYPAFYLSSFSPYEVLKGEMKNSMKSGRMRKVLVVFQFSVSILLIIGTMVMYRQISFMVNKDVGFNKENLIVINRAAALRDKVRSFKETVKKIPGVVNIASSTAVPGRNNNNNGYGIEGRNESFLLQTNWIDYDYIDTYGMTMADGRNFQESYTTDQEACLVNETTVKDFSINDISQIRFLQPRDSGRYDNRQIIGVVKNFNFESLRNPISPYMLQFKKDNILWGYLSVKLNGQNIAQTISEIEKVWKEYLADDPLQYYFLDEDFEQMYSQEKQNAQMAVIFSILAIFIAGLGLYGLTSFTVEQRTKEIGVRKAMGSSAIGIYYVISKEIMVLVTISAIISWPVIYYAAGNWLENFHYRINLGIFIFLAGLGIALTIALVTISYKVLQAARLNPAQSLKYE
jgi:putative ABC transport system permease protein